MYSTPTDVRMALTPNASPTDLETAAGLSDAQINDAIAEADGIIDTYIALWYTIPSVTIANPAPAVGDPPVVDPAEVQVAPAPVRVWSRDIAAYLATLTFMRHKDVTEDDPIRLRYNMVMVTLLAIRDRKSFLDTDVFPPKQDTSNAQGVAVFNQYEGSLFTPQDFRLAPEGYTQPQVYWPYRTI